MDRRGLTTSVGVLGGLGALAGFVLVYAARIAPRWLEVVELRVGIPALPDALAGARIAHLSDFHAGGAVPAGLLHRAKSIALNHAPDLVALTGDFYDDGVVRDVGDLFSRWPERLPVVAVLGNHDHRAPASDLDRLVGELTSAGVEVLNNRAIQVQLHGEPVWVVGVDDPFSWKMDQERAFLDVPVGEDALLFLAHSPVAVTTIPIGRVRLMLAGHTHGGQVRIVPDGRVPFAKMLRRLLGNPPRPDPPVHRGVHWMRGAVLVISTGLGISKLPLRFRTRPQVILIEVVRATDTGPPCDDVRRYMQRMNSGTILTRWLS